MSEQSPRCLSEERMRLDVGSACARSESAQFILDEELADERFTKAMRSQQNSIIAERRHTLRNVRSA